MAGDGWRRQGYSVATMRQLARAALPRPIFDFADGGAEEERTVRRNEAAFQDIALLPRPLNGAATRDLSLTLFGRQLDMPVIIGPTGLAGLFWPNGEALTARAATAAGTAYCLSHGSVCALEALDSPEIGTRWMQVFIYRDRAFTLELTQRAAAAGYHALVLTIDNQMIGRRERDIVNGFAIPPRFKALDKLAMATKVGWLMRMRQELPRVTFGNYVRAGEPSDVATLAGRMGQLLDPGMTWADVDLVRQAWKGPLILKGVLHPDEAKEAISRGVDGLIVSNHGGRQVDGAAASIEALPGVVEAVAGRVPVLIDGGIRRGGDVVRAIATGATACLIGRPHLWGVSVAGEAGVAHVLELYRSEIDRVMGLMGASSLNQLSTACILPRSGSRS